MVQRSGAAFSYLTTTITTTTTQFPITSLNRITELIGLLVQCSTVALYPLDDVGSCVSGPPKIRSFPKIFLGTFENAALVPEHL